MAFSVQPLDALYIFKLDKLMTGREQIFPKPINYRDIFGKFFCWAFNQV